MNYVFAYLALILIHELGHVLFALLFSVRIEKVSIFFGSTPIKKTWFISRRIGEYSFDVETFTVQLGWLPFGGYVKLKGMTNNEGKGSFILADLWKRKLIVAGGFIANIATTIILLSFYHTRLATDVACISALMGAINLLPFRADGKQLIKLQHEQERRGE